MSDVKHPKRGLGSKKLHASCTPRYTAKRKRRFEQSEKAKLPKVTSYYNSNTSGRLNMWWMARHLSLRPMCAKMCSHKISNSYSYSLRAIRYCRRRRWDQSWLWCIQIEWWKRWSAVSCYYTVGMLTWQIPLPMNWHQKRRSLFCLGLSAVSG